MVGVKTDGHDEVMEEAFSRLIHDQHFNYYPTRLRFIEVFKGEPMKTHFLSLIKTMKATYIDMFEKFCKGKKFLKFQTAWFLHVNIYFDSSFKVQGMDNNMATELQKAWKVVLKLAAESECLLPEEDQRIIVAILSSTLFELMSEKNQGSKNRRVPFSSVVIITCYCQL